MSLRTNWVVSNNPPVNTLAHIKSLCPRSHIWGGWSSWHQFMTDNVICHDHPSAATLVDKKFHRQCNLFFPATFKLDFGTLPNVTYYGGEFAHEIDNREEVVALHLAGANSDIVLLHGFDWRGTSDYADDFDRYKKHCYKSLVTEALKSMPMVQWVLVNHTEMPFEELSGMDNVCCDSLDAVKALLTS